MAKQAKPLRSSTKNRSEHEVKHGKMDAIIKLFKEDLLKGIYSLLLTARHSNDHPNQKASISIGLLIVLSAVLAVVRALYAPAGAGIVEHFISTFCILVSFYLVFGFGTLMFLRRSGLTKINRYAATVFTCLLATGILYFCSILLFRFFTVSLLDWIDDHLLPASIRDSWVVITVEDWIPAILFSALGCLLVLGNGHLDRTSIARRLAFFAFTTAIFYFAVFERGGFFDNVTQLLGDIVAKSTHHDVVGEVLLSVRFL